jgi:hypothetical protein
MEPRSGSAVPARSLAARLHVNQRTLQIALGVLWIIDGLLKFQPKLFNPGLVSTVIRPMAAGQPTVLGSSIGHMANFLSHEVAMWDVLFGLIEVGIGVGILFRRSLKPALVTSFIWGVGVYVFGEGLGMVLTGDTSPLAGAPGAVCFYMLLGFMLWPRSESNDDGAVGAGSSAAARGLFGGTGSLLVWAFIWVFEAVVWMFPFNRTGNAIPNQMLDTSAGEPGWYAHLLNSFGHAFEGAGIEVAVMLAALSLVVALGPLVSNRPQLFIGLGIGLALLYWVTGEGLGAILTGSGTDPNNGPIVALIGLSVLPLVPARADEPAPVALLAATRPLAGILTVLALAVVPLAVAVVPTSSDAVAPLAAPTTTSAPSSSSGSPAMNGMSMTGSPNRSSSFEAGTRGSSTDTHSMNMAAMAGLNVTDPHWKYTGPPLSAAEVRELTVVSGEQDKGHAMQTPDCTARPTATQVLGAAQYVQATSAAVAKYAHLSTAIAAGYVPITSTRYPVVHYLNFRYMNRGDIMNPEAVDSLVYATTPYGPVLVAAMYLMPGAGDGPMPYGCLVQWHAHTNLCSSDATGQIDGLQPCAAGSHANPTTPFMTHVWQVPVAGGPLAIDPSDLQVVQAAIMAQEKGLAPTTTGTPPPS